MAFGMIAGGWLFARLHHAASVRTRHAAVPAAGLAASGAFAVLGTLCNDPMWALVTFSLAMASAGLSEGSFWTTAIEIGGSAGGLSSAIMNTGGHFGGALAPMRTPLLASHLGWQGGIALASVFCFVGATLWHWIVPRQEPAG
jgi:MFS family permease